MTNQNQMNGMNGTKVEISFMVFADLIERCARMEERERILRKKLTGASDNEVFYGSEILAIIGDGE